MPNCIATFLQEEHGIAFDKTSLPFLSVEKRILYKVAFLNRFLSFTLEIASISAWRVTASQQNLEVPPRFEDPTDMILPPIIIAA
jgi:hypothetical protein